MNETYNVTVRPSGARVRVPAGTPVSRLLFARNEHIESPCGGAGKCGKCRVIAKGALSPLSQTEKEHLSLREQQEGYRLACCAVVKGDCEIVIPAGSAASRQQILTETSRIDVPPAPRTEKKYVELKEAALGECRSEAERILGAAGKTAVAPALAPLLAKKARDAKYRFTAVCFDDSIIDIEPGDTSGSLYGAAFDIGSTTLAGYLSDLSDGRIIAKGAMMNPQILFGDDLISRINYIGESRERLEDLRAPLWEALSRITGDMAREAGISRKDIYTATVAGNTCMCHIAAGIPPFTLGVSPYIPTDTKAADMAAADTGLDINPAGVVQFLPCIGGFVGADNVAVILSAMPETDRTLMAVDIGTNGEIALWHKGRLSVCSAAAGPAFEGAGISCGMRGGAGAIDKVYMENGVFTVRVCGGEKAKGICGSGLVDAVKVLLQEGAVDISGRLLSPDEFSGNPSIAERLREGEKGAEFVIALPEESFSGYPVTLKHSDIRSLQLAKGSICAAVRTLLEHNGISEGDLEGLFLAGGFGNYLDKGSAIAIGLLPRLDPSLIIPAGNGAGTGAVMALISRDCLERAKEIAAAAEHLELALSPGYQMNLMDAMMFYQEGDI
ncbi:MAG: DUF4445 domain-containing protein [Abditibacteriota bacterium]|nr:DUF4445 domain-containing protein [Abditibacteriota bacterium]